MFTKRPRINMVIEKPVFSAIKKLAEENDLSLSAQVRELVLKALEELEDIELSVLAAERLRTFSRSKALSHKQLWKGSNKK